LFKSFDQAVKDDVGTIRIQRPHKGPFYVSPRPIDQLIANLGKWARLCLCIYLHASSSPSFFFFFFFFFFKIKNLNTINRDVFNRWYKYASMGLTAFGVYLIAKRAFQYIMERRRRWELQKRYFVLVFYHCYLETQNKLKVTDLLCVAKKSHLFDKILITNI
jgi:E3 ubiquitin-protein ligase MUL1